jgi:UDP-N-acetylglucosamine diphosphorylase/glucosamine-1-phosphate N-acetyltransferase
MDIFLDDTRAQLNLRPFTFTRHTADIRVGILTIREKWERLTGRRVYTTPDKISEQTLVIQADILPALSNYELIMQAAIDKTPLLESEEIKILHYPWQIFMLNDWAIRQDFELITRNRISEPIPVSNAVINKEQVFLEPGARVEHCILNGSNGPVYLGKDSEMMEGSMVRGAFALGEAAIVKMGTKIYGATTIGPHCVAGGEIKNSVLFANSNKAHDGYLGDSVIGEWCNLGAGTSNSNVKNTGGQVKYIVDKEMNSIIAGNKAGLLMGDYSRAAINTSFNTGSIVGVGCNIFGVPPGKFVENFSWGGESYVFEKLIADINNWMKMKGKELSSQQIDILKKIATHN